MNISLREKAIKHLLSSKTAQEVFELGWQCLNTAIYICPNGEFEQYQHSNSTELESVYFQKMGCPIRLSDFGMWGYSYSGDELDYRKESGEIKSWRDFQEEHPCASMIEAIEAIVNGFFDDEKKI